LSKGYLLDNLNNMINSIVVLMLLSSFINNPDVSQEQKEMAYESVKAYMCQEEIGGVQAQVLQAPVAPEPVVPVIVPVPEKKKVSPIEPLKPKKVVKDSDPTPYEARGIYDLTAPIDSDLKDEIEAENNRTTPHGRAGMPMVSP
jgi:hypothetical protein